MKRNLSVLAVTVLFALGLSRFALAGQDPNDHGVADTLYLDVWPGDKVLHPPGPWDIRCNLRVTNDIPDPSVDSIAAIVVPLCFTSSSGAANATIDPTKNNTDLYPFPTIDNSVFRHMPNMSTRTEENWMMAYSEAMMGEEWDTRILDLTSQTQIFWLCIVPTGTQDKRFTGGSRLLTATITFTVEDSTVICLDTCLWPPPGHLCFSRSDAYCYVPQIWDDYLEQESYCFRPCVGEGPTFIAHFTTREGEPYPFDVIVSDGEWVQEFDDATYVETEVPEAATYTVRYSFGEEDEIRSRLYFPFVNCETREFEFFLPDSSEWYRRTRPVLTYQEIGAEAILTWQWDEINNTLTYNVTVSDTSKLVGTAVFVGFCTGPLYAIEEEQFVGVLSPCSGHKCSSHSAQYIHDLTLGDFYCMVKYAEIDSNFGALRVGSAFHNDAYILVTWEETSFVWDLSGTLYEPEFIDPQYALPPGSYIVQPYGLPGAYVVPRMPVRIEEGIEIYFELFPSTLPVSPDCFTFRILAERPFTDASFYNPFHAPGDSITVHLMTGEYAIQDWWGCFVLPDTLTVDQLLAYPDAGGVDTLEYGIDWLDNQAPGHNMVTVRIAPWIRRLNLIYRGRSTSVVIPNVECANPGDHVCLPILLDNNTTPFGGFELEVEFDYTSMTFVSAQTGELIEGFELFTYRLLPCPACGCCKYKILLYGQHDIPNGVENIGEPIPMTPPGEHRDLVNLCFVVNNDENLRGLKIPVCWEWEGTVVNDTLVEDWECSENTFSSWSGDTLYTSSLLCQFNPDICDDPSDRVQSVLIFQDGVCGQNCGGVDICPAGPDECKRGDVNFNTLTYEVADAVLFASYFVEGTSVFRYDEAYQICATDVNADGRTLTLSDLVYLIRVVLQDAAAIPKPTPSSEVANVIVSGGTISTECAVPIGAILFEFDGTVSPTLLADMEMINRDNKVLVWSCKGKSLSTVEVLSHTGEAELVTVTAVDRDSRELSTSITGRVAPRTFALHPAYPNPFNPFTNLSFNLPEATSYSLKIYNVTGQLVRTYEGAGSVGLNVINWDSKDNAGAEVASGVYFYKLTAGRFSATEKMVMMK